LNYFRGSVCCLFLTNPKERRLPIVLFQRIGMVCCFDFGHHRSGIHLINPTPGNPLDPIYSLNRLYRYSSRF
jgi:hypothetical protein